MAEPFMRLGRLIFSNRTGDIRAELPFSMSFRLYSAPQTPANRLH